MNGADHIDAALVALGLVGSGFVVAAGVSYKSGLAIEKINHVVTVVEDLRARLVRLENRIFNKASPE